MDLAILSDLHLTNNLPYTVAGDYYRKNQLEKYITEFFLKIKEEVDVLVIPGDICHSTNLGPDDLDLLMFFIDKVKESKIRTIFCLGNHDLDGSKSILSFLNRIDKFSNIHYKEGLSHTYIYDDAIFDVINYCPHHVFLKRALFLGENQPRTRYSVLVGHIGVKGTLHGTTKSIVGVKKEDIEKFSEYYDLIILGHHHKFQWVTDKCLYAGAIQQTRIDEINTVPGGLIVSLPHLTTKLIENTFSPRFAIVDQDTFVPEIVANSIVKPIVDTEGKTEEENKEFLKEIVAQGPYYLIKPRLKRTFLIKEGGHEYSVTKKRIALLKTMKEFDLKEKRPKKFYTHTLDMYEKIKGSS